MKKAILLLVFLFISSSISSQEDMKKVPLKPGAIQTITYKDLTISTLLQVYDKNSSNHVSGDMHLRVENNGEPIVDFYIDTDQTTKEYPTKAYKNYFLTFTIENNIKYLIITQAQFGKAFALLHNSNVVLGEKVDAVEIEFTDYIQEWGYDAPPEAENRNYFTAVNYNLSVTIKEVTTSYSFYSYELEDHYSIDLGSHNLLVLSDAPRDSSCIIEMILNKKE